MKKAAVIIMILGAIIWGILVGPDDCTFYECETDDECTQQCLSTCFGDSCRECWDVFISVDNYDFYEVKK